MDLQQGCVGDGLCDWPELETGQPSTSQLRVTLRLMRSRCWSLGASHSDFKGRKNIFLSKMSASTTVADAQAEQGGRCGAKIRAVRKKNLVVRNNIESSINGYPERDDKLSRNIYRQKVSITRYADMVGSFQNILALSDIELRRVTGNTRVLEACANADERLLVTSKEL